MFFFSKLHDRERAKDESKRRETQTDAENPYRGATTTILRAELGHRKGANECRKCLESDRPRRTTKCSIIPHRMERSSMEMSCAENVSANRTVWNKVTPRSKFTAEPDDTMPEHHSDLQHRTGLHRTQWPPHERSRDGPHNQQRGFCAVTFENKRHETQVKTFA